MRKTQTSIMLQNRQEFLSERERSSNPFNVQQRLSLNQTADLAGGSPLRLIGRATNEWQILRRAAPHARPDTRCYFLGICDIISKSAMKIYQMIIDWIQDKLQSKKRAHIFAAETFARKFTVTGPVKVVTLRDSPWRK